MNMRAILEAKQAKTAEANGTGFRQSVVTDMVMDNPTRRLNVTYKHTAEEYNDAADQLNDATQRMEEALSKLISSGKETSEKTKDVVSRAKASAAQIGDALARVNRLLGTDFESRLAQVERLADSLTKLAELERTGKLQGVMKALGQA